jgi:hypothetical protein
MNMKIKTSEIEPAPAQSCPTRQRIFPLHITPFERYMLTDDRPKYPSTFILQLEFSGDLDRNSFQASIDEALERHPLLRALIRPAKQHRDCWVDSGANSPMVHFGDLGDPLEFPGAGIERIDLRYEPGLRVWVRHDKSQAVMTVQMHHAVCDGIGGYYFIGDVLWSYAKRMGTDAIEDSVPLPSSRLRDRGLASYDPKHFLTDKGRFQNEWVTASKLMFSRNWAIRPSKPHPSATKATSPFPGIVSFEFDKNDHRRLRLASQNRGQNLNDLLLEKLFVTLDQANIQDRNWLGGKQVCVMMPMDLREPGDPKFSACNVVSYAFIRRGGKLIRQPAQLRKSLSEETLQLKHHRHRTRFMNLVVGSRKYPSLLKAILHRNHCLATVILSNTGDPTKRFLVNLPRENGLVRCGNLVLTDIFGVPPIRKKTRATISIFTYRRVLKICLRCDPHLFNLEQTKSLLHQYVDQVKSVLD